MASRFSHPKFEEKYDWLPPLLDLYYLSDLATERFLSEKGFQGVKVGCRKGCSHCCSNMSVPLNEHEFKGISWFICELYDSKDRKTIKNRLQNALTLTECPFLINNACQVYPVRPLICRQFHVALPACNGGEDIAKERPHAILSPTPDFLFPVINHLLEMFGHLTRAQKATAFDSGLLVERARNIHEIDWRDTANLMDYYERIGLEGVSKLTSTS